MLIVTFLLFGTVYGSSNFKLYCQGVDRSISELYQYKGPLYFTPDRPKYAKQRKVMDRGKSLDRLFTFRGGKVYLTKLSKSHEGTLEATLKTQPWTLTIRILECFERHYMDDFTYKVPDKAFSLRMKTKDSTDQPVLLWDVISFPEETYVKDNKWTMDSLTQADSGLYYFYDENDMFLSGVKLTVKENTFQYKLKANENVTMKYPWSGGPWNIRFISKDKEKMLMKEGQLVLTDTEFSRRIIFENKILQINSLTTADTGTFQFTDKEDNLAMSVEVKVISESNHIITAAVVCSLVVLVIVGGCCYWKCKDDSCADTPDESPPAPSNATTVNPPQPESSYPLLSQANTAYPPQSVPNSYPQANPAYPPQTVPNSFPLVPQPNPMYPPEPVPNLYPQVTPSPAPCS